LRVILMGKNQWTQYVMLPALLIFAVGCGKSGSANARASAGAMPAAPVTVATAVQQSVPLEVAAIGNVQPYRTVQVKSMVDGQLARVLVEQGQNVRRGELLFQLDKRPFEAAVAQAQGAESGDCDGAEQPGASEPQSGVAEGRRCCAAIGRGAASASKVGCGRSRHGARGPAHRKAQS
jgi:multidrug efflux system membrane fusion protein